MTETTDTSIAAPVVEATTAPVVDLDVLRALLAAWGTKPSDAAWSAMLLLATK